MKEAKDVPLHDNDNQSALSDHEVIANIKSTVLAGSETTAVVICWTLYYLSFHPQYFERARQEVDEKLPDLEKIESCQCRIELPFIAACFRESLRIKGPASFIGASKFFFFLLF